MAAVFLSYRGQADGDQVDRLATALARAFGRGRVLVDVEALRADEDDRAAIASALDDASVGLVLVGPAGLAAPDALMAAELEAALDHRLPLQLALLPGAEPPQRAQLPAALAALADCPVLRLRAQQPGDLEALMAALATRGALERHDADADKARLATPRRFHWLVAGVVALLLALMGLGFWAGQAGADTSLSKAAVRR